jgi:hypothetical protein
MSKTIEVSEALKILKDKIRFIRRAHNGEYIFKCPFCGDNDHPYHGHLYINHESGVFNCYRCDMGGNLNRILYLFEGNKFKVPSKYVFDVKKIKQEGLSYSNDDFEKYLKMMEIQIQYTASFDILNTIEKNPIMLAKHKIFSDRTIRDNNALYLFNYTNTKQHLMTYYSEHYMNKLLECEALPQSKSINDFVQSYILKRCTSMLFFGHNKTLNVFKNDSKDMKYFKIKKNILYGENIFWDFFFIINQNKYRNSLNEIYKEKVLNVYFAEGIFDAINLYLYNPKYATGVEPDIIVSTGSKVSYASALYFIRDTFFKPVVSHLFLDPEIRYKEFIKKYRLLRKVYHNAIAYQNGDFDYGDLQQSDLSKIKICENMG